MTPADWSFHHLGLAVRQPQKAAQYLRSLGYNIGSVVRDDLQNVHLMLCHCARMPAVEIVYPTETRGPLDRILSDGKEGVYHLCYEVPTIENAIRALENSGVRAVCVAPAKPAILFGNRSVAFFFVVGFGLIELLESTRRQQE